MGISPLSSSVASTTASQIANARSVSDPFSSALSSAVSGGAAGASSTNSTTAALKQQSAASLSEFKRTLKQIFADANIDTSQPIRLESDGNGGVTVVGSHPDRAKIEQIFSENPDLAAKFQTLARQFSDLQAAQSGSSNGQSLLGPTFGLAIVNDDYEVAFK